MIDYIKETASSPEASRALIQQSMQLATGTWMLAEQQTRSAQFAVTGEPIGEWGETVNEVENPFSYEYDREEYKNLGLRMLNLAEIAFICEACGVQPPWAAKSMGTELNDKRWLEVGCGTGRIALLGAAFGAYVTAFDQSEGYVEVTAAKMKQLPAGMKDPTLLVTPAETIDNSKRYEVITAIFGVLNHCENWQQVIERLSGMLERDGKFIVSMYGSPEAAVYDELSKGLPYAPAILTRRAAGGLLLGENAEKVLPSRFPYPNLVLSELEKNGLQISRVEPFLTVTSLYPSQPTPENIGLFLKVAEKRFGKGIGDTLRAYETSPAQLLVACLGADYDIGRERINEAAYFGIVAEKKGKD